MDRSTPITLISVDRTQDSRGVTKHNETSRKVYARVKSATASEFFEGGRNGLKPVYVFEVFTYDYNAEPIAVYNGKRYSVYRTYCKGEITELHVQLKAGTQV